MKKYAQDWTLDSIEGAPKIGTNRIFQGYPRSSNFLAVLLPIGQLRATLSLLNPFGH